MLRTIAVVVLAVWADVALWWLGYQFAVAALHDEQADINRQKAALAIEWHRLDQVRRIRAVFLAAHHAMHAEAEHHLRSTAMSGEQEHNT